MKSVIPVATTTPKAREIAIGPTKKFACEGLNISGERPTKVVAEVSRLPFEKLEGTGEDVYDLKAVHRNHVALLPVLILQESQAGRAAGIILDGDHLGAIDPDGRGGHG